MSISGKLKQCNPSRRCISFLMWSWQEHSSLSSLGVWKPHHVCPYQLCTFLASPELVIKKFWGKYIGVSKAMKEELLHFLSQMNSLGCLWLNLLSSHVCLVLSARSIPLVWINDRFRIILTKSLNHYKDSRQKNPNTGSKVQDKQIQLVLLVAWILLYLWPYVNISWWIIFFS